MVKIGIVFLINLLFLANTTTGQTFRVDSTNIIDPEGNVFLIKGVNVNGPYWPWSRSTVDDVPLITDTWKFNTVRVNILPRLKGIFPNNNTNLDAIVDSFTARKVVTIIENQSSI